jgi:VIT1/CCC1 family predicted Fe2+/Mn2+ transporter
VTFSAGAAIPLLVAASSPAQGLALIVSGSSLLCLAILGAIGARIGGAPALKPAVRVTFWGAIAMGITAAIGAVTGQVL